MSMVKRIMSSADDIARMYLMFYQQPVGEHDDSKSMPSTCDAPLTTVQIRFEHSTGALGQMGEKMIFLNEGDGGVRQRKQMKASDLE
eukprot:12773460-Ditylum_brightwellii.AAC.1